MASHHKCPPDITKYQPSTLAALLEGHFWRPRSTLLLALRCELGSNIGTLRMKGVHLLQGREGAGYLILSCSLAESREAMYQELEPAAVNLTTIIADHQLISDW